MDRARAASKGRFRAAALLVAALSLAFAFAADGFAGGGRYTIDGGTKAQRAQVRLALEASAFDWGLIPSEVQIKIRRGVQTQSWPGEIWLDARLLSTGQFAWAVVQEEYAHQIDYFLLSNDARTTLNEALGGSVWCRIDVANLPHSAYGCERFASAVVWSYWPDEQNAYRPRGSADETVALEPGPFRALLDRLLGIASVKRTLLLHPDGDRR